MAGNGCAYPRRDDAPRRAGQAARAVDATTDDERAAAVAALEEYEGSNGACSDCQNKNRSVGAANPKTPSNKCINFATTGCTKKATGGNRPCPDCKAEEKQRAARST